MSTLAEEPAGGFKLSEILAPLVKERVDACMADYVTKDYLNAVLNTAVTKLENRLLMYLGGLVGASLVLTLGGVKLMLPETVNQTAPSVIVVQPAQTAPALPLSPAVPNPVPSAPTH